MMVCIHLQSIGCRGRKRETDMKRMDERERNKEERGNERRNGRRENEGTKEINNKTERKPIFGTTYCHKTYYLQLLTSLCT
jgi:hypothetical protein